MLPGDDDDELPYRVIEEETGTPTATPAARTPSTPASKAAAPSSTDDNDQLKDFQEIMNG
jgi:hypothetical protein